MNLQRRSLLAASLAAPALAQAQSEWSSLIDAVLQQACLKRPPDGGFVPSGNHGIHSEHLTYLLGEMQSLARAHPKAVW